jgi:transcriptional regulator with XRE-family HTH domain
MNSTEHARRRRLVNRMLRAQARLGMSDKDLQDLSGIGRTSISGWRRKRTSVPTGKRVELVETAISVLEEEEARRLNNGKPSRRPKLRLKVTPAFEPVPKPKPEPTTTPTVGERVMDAFEEWLVGLSPREFGVVMARVLMKRGG